MISVHLPVWVLVVVAVSLPAVEIDLGEPVEAIIYSDGARVVYRVQLPAGDHVITMPTEIGELRAVTGVQVWHEEQGERSVPADPLPQTVVALAQQGLGLRSEARRIVAEETLQQHLLKHLAHRINGGEGEAPPTGTWQTMLDQLLLEQASLDQRRVDLDVAFQDLRQQIAEMKIGEVMVDDVVALPPRIWDLVPYAELAGVQQDFDLFADQA